MLNFIEKQQVVVKTTHDCIFIQIQFNPSQKKYFIIQMVLTKKIDPLKTAYDASKDLHLRIYLYKQDLVEWLPADVKSIAYCTDLDIESRIEAYKKTGPKVYSKALKEVALAAITTEDDDDED